MNSQSAFLFGSALLGCLGCSLDFPLSNPTGPQNPGPVSGFYVINATQVQLTVGDTFDFFVSYTGNDRTWEIASFALSNPALATVTPAGMLVAQAPGALNVIAQITSDRGPGSAFGTVNILEPPAFVAHDVVSVADLACAARTASVDVLCWPYGRDGSGVAFPPSVLAGAPDFKQIDMGTYHSCGVSADSLAYCWGTNLQGELGTGNTTPRTVPTLVAGGLKWIRVSVGYEFSCGLAADSTAYCWGSGHSGQLGTGGVAPSTVPVPVSTAPKFTSLDVGHYHTCGVRADGAVLCWGNGASALTGVMDPANVLAPRVIPDIPLMSQVAAGAYHSCAITLDGVAWCWGLGARGELGRPVDAYMASLPTPVSGPPPLVFIAAEDSKSCGLTVAGRAWCWGERPIRERMFSSIEAFPTPAELPGDVAFVSIDLGLWAGCGITVNGELMCWGGNLNGVIGDGTMINRLAPRRVRP